MAIKRAKIWPPPVYVATFADGTVCRMSCGDYRPGKAATGYDFDRGRAVCCSAIGAERGWNQFIHTVVNWHPDTMRSLLRPATDIMAGHFEYDGETIPDPFFAKEDTAPTTQRKSSPLERLIASLDRLGLDDLVRLSVEVDARLETAE